MSYFVKFWEDSIYHPLWRNDPVAWKLFEYLLVTSYAGSPQGTTVKTLQQITEVCGGKNSTNYKAIKRLEKYEMVKTETNYKRTTFKIVNWWKYQGSDSNGKNTVKTESKLSNTLYKNKEYKNKEEEEPFKHFLKPQKTKTKLSKQGTSYSFAKELCEYFNSELGGQCLTDDNLLAGVNLFEQHGRDKVLSTADYIIHLPPKEYQVKVRSPKELAQKWPKVIELTENPPKEESKYGIKY